MSICESIKKRYIRLSKGQRKVAQYVVDNPNVVATQVASEVGRLAGVSESTVIRFCYAMSLSGYSELQEKMKQYILEKDGVVPSIPKSRKLKKQNIPLNEVITKDMKDLLSVIQQTDEQQCNEVIKLLHEAKDIYVVGFQEALPVAFSLYFELGKYRNRVHMLQYDEAKLSVDLMHMNDSSALIIVNADDEQEEILTIAEIANRKKATIVSITGNQSPKLEKQSTILYNLNGKKHFEDGTVAMYAFVRALVKCLVAQFEDNYMKTENESGERFIRKLIEVS